MQSAQVVQSVKAEYGLVGLLHVFSLTLDLRGILYHFEILRYYSSIELPQPSFK